MSIIPMQHLSRSECALLGSNILAARRGRPRWTHLKRGRRRAPGDRPRHPADPGSGPLNHSNGSQE